MGAHPPGQKAPARGGRPGAEPPGPPLPPGVPRRAPRPPAPARPPRRRPPRRRCPPTGAGRPTRASRATIGRRSATAQLVSGSIGAQDAAPLFVWFPQPSPRTSFVAVQRFWFVVLMAGLGARPGATQARASFGVGAGTVRYSGGTSFSSATFSPAAGFASLNLAADVSGSFASLPGGVWSGQGRGDLWVASGAVFHEWRLGLEGVLAGTSRTDGAWTAAAQGNVELLWSQPQWAGALAPGPAGAWTVKKTPSRRRGFREPPWGGPAAPALRLSINPPPSSAAGSTAA